VPTNLLLLPQLTASFDWSCGDDVLDAIEFVVAPASTTPLSIAGIEFEATLSRAIDSPAVARMSTANGFLVNGGANGILSFAVPGERPSTDAPALCTARLTPGSYVMGLIARADGKSVNLFLASGPATVTLAQKVGA